MQLSVAEAAAHLDVSEDTVYGWIRAREIPFLRLNEQYRLNSADLLEWAVARGHRLSLEMLRSSHGDCGLAQALEVGGVHRLPGRHGRRELLEALVGGVGGLEEADRGVLLELLLASEGLGPTGLGGGIAIPHVRAPVVVHGAAASAALWYLDELVDCFGAADGTPVDTVFFLVTPTPRAHLQLVSRLMGALHDEPFRQALRARADLEALLGAVRRLEGGLTGGPG
jgi:PTS system nitrogen regulatory IIA component